MSLFKCKCCGADLHVKEGDKVVTCDYCGSTQTIPSSQDANVLSVYARGNLLRSQGEFEKAYATFSKLLDGESEDAEAHWNLLLCKYGITYVDDYDGRKKPTINRMSMSSILDDEEYRKALSLADAVAKEQYQEEAASIAKIQDGILQIVQKEKPYDIFISYKETDEFNGRTEDSVLAQEIYDKLTEEGYRVFLSRVSLSSVVGHEYEPYIYSALYTAKAMILVVCNPDYVSAVWVKNEWQRYLFMMQKEKGKILIPCYRGVDPYDLPKELRRLQGIDASKLGWMQDLSLGLKKVIKKEKEVIQEKTVIASGSLDGMADQMIKRGFDFLKKGSPAQAKKLFEESLSYADKALAHMGLLCVGRNKQDLAGLASLHKDIADDPHYASALKIASDDERKSIEGIRESILRNIAADEAAIEKEKKERYDKAISFKNNGDYVEAAKRFSELFDFLDAEAQYDECQRLKAQEDRRKAEAKAAKEKAERLAKYYSQVAHISGYKKATSKELENALSMARVLKSENYGGNVSGYVTTLTERISAKRRIKKIAVISCLVAACLAVFVPTMTFSVFIPLGRQSEIISAIEGKDYAKAAKLLDENGDFGESKKLKAMASAGRYLERSNYSEALYYLSYIGGDYSIGLDYEGGNGNAKVSLNGNYVVTNEATKNGYSFNRWMVDDYSLDARNYSASMTLYASYSVNTYKITYDLGGGTNNPSNPSTYTTEDATVKLKDPTRDGYTFAGWSDGSKAVTTIDRGSYGDLTLIANWTAITYSIAYDLDGGTLENEPVAYTIEDSVALPTPNKRGYTFLGWTGSNGEEAQIGYVQPVGTFGDRSYKANWEATTYSITYDLDGGTLTQSVDDYTIEKEITLPQPTKTGYEFTGWTGSNGDTPEANVIISLGTIGNLQYTAHWKLAVYSITYDLAGGTVSAEFPTSFTMETETFTVPEPERYGYKFAGWERSGWGWGVTIYNGKVAKGTTRDIVFVAHWTPIAYLITYGLDGGTNGSSNPKTYTIEDDVVLENPAKEGYTFEGWYSDEACSAEEFSGIQSGSTGNVNVYAKWRANKNSLVVSSDDLNKGNVSVSGEGYTDEKITIQATPTGDWAFKGWYSASSLISCDNPYTFSMPAKDYSLKAVFCTKSEVETLRKTLYIDPIIDSESNTLTYGLYPQKRVSDSATLASLNALTFAESNGWYLLNGEYYAKKEADPYNSSYFFDDGTKIVEGTTYWFKCEPITWKILSSSDGEYSLVSTVLLDAHRYAASSNNYKNSEIRTWLNGDFYDSAFSLGNSLIQTTTVDNSASTTGSSSNKHACDNTEDKVYLLSYKDYLNADYGFSTSSSTYDTARRCKTTDWARANGAYYSTNSYYLYNGSYWPRSPDSSSFSYAWLVSYDGVLSYSGVSGSHFSVRPSLRIKVA